MDRLLAKLILVLLLDWGMHGVVVANNSNPTTTAISQKNAKISFDFQDIPIKSALQILANTSGVNIVATNGVKGKIALSLQDITWDEALELILKSNSLGKIENGNIITVAPIDDIIKIKTRSLQESKLSEQLQPLLTEHIKINHNLALDVEKLLLDIMQNYSKNTVYTEVEGIPPKTQKPNNILSSRGRLVADTKNNTIIAIGSKEYIAKIKGIIKPLDVPLKQVMIEARIVTADTNFVRELGVDFDAKRAEQLQGNSINGSAAPNYSQRHNAAFALAADAINGNPAAALGMTLARGANYVLNLELTALENEGRGKILANPRVLTLDNQTAYIKQGQLIRYETTSDKGTKTELIDAVLELNVTPHITHNHDVIMNLTIKKDALVNGTRDISKREVSTRVRVKNGQTIVLGGVYEDSQSNNEYRIPYLSAIPLLGDLFTKEKKSTIKQELLIFVTPTIYKGLPPSKRDLDFAKRNSSR